MTQRTRVLTLTGFYLPGYKAGGPLRTIANMVDFLSDEFQFLVITRDRDLGDTVPYNDIVPNKWQPMGKAMVIYLSPDRCNLSSMVSLICSTRYDLLYLNSFFDPVFTIKPLLARKLCKLPAKPVIVAPRGEFSSGALQFKYIKKLTYIKVVTLFGLYNNVIWQASTEFEAQDIIKAIGVDPVAIHVAMDLPALITADSSTIQLTQPDADHQGARLVFLSRISPKKNLDYALRVLAKVTTPVSLDIYGPVEEAGYWQQCQSLLAQLPANIIATYKGSIAADQVKTVFSKYDLFFFPTRGENYGHVIAESLSVGTPVLISDQTPWRNLVDDRLGWDLPLAEDQIFAEKIEECAGMAVPELVSWRKYITEKIVDRLANPLVFEANRELFRKTLFKS